mmetsp:Transcript_4924/g.10788  ORF Transcript_4924/g.10788 Transcript_4924/m.10788 type:complete len:348 (-) Transcript_4924:784-1827(-)
MMPSQSATYICSTASELQRSRDIQKQAERDYYKGQEEIKLLLLGAGESGKSTVFKQMKILYGAGFSADDKANFRTKIHQNVLTGIQALCTAVMDLGLTGETDDDALELMDEILNISEGQVDLSEDKDIGNKLSSLWRDPAIQAAWDRRSEFHIIESHAAYFEKMDVICAPNYEPSKDDILASRVRTTGVIQEEYMIWGSKFVIIDVGGQTSERRKWVHHFDACQAILFVAALSEYDQYLFEDNTKNRMVDALELFEKICNEKLFKETHMILFLNKRDLFEQKIQHTAISSVPFVRHPNATPTLSVSFIQHTTNTNHHHKRLCKPRLVRGLRCGGAARERQGCRDGVL